MEETSSIRTSFLVVSLLALVWLALALWVMISEGQQPQSLTAAIQTFGVLLAPVAALFALASAIGNRERLPVLKAADSLDEAESRIAGVATRIESLRASLSTELEALAVATAALEDQSRTARALVADIGAASATADEASRRLAAALPDAARQANALAQALADAGRTADAQAERAETAARALSGLVTELDTSGSTAAANLGEALASLETRAEAGRAASEAGMRAIRGEADSLFDLIENTLVAKREATQRQADAMAAQLVDAYTRFDAVAEAAGTALARRLTELAQQADVIEARLAAQVATTDALAQSGERAFQLLDARLEHSSETSRTTLDRLAQRVQEVGADLSHLTQPLRETQGAAHELDLTVKALRETALQTTDVLGEMLPARTVEAGRAAETLTGELNALIAAIDGAHDRAAALADPIESSRAAIEAASAAYADQRTGIEAAGHALVVELEQARQLIAEVEEQTRDTSLAAASRLVDAMARVRDVATQATGTMRDMLDNLLAEARESLSRTASDAMRQSFAEPIAEHARAAEAAAGAAAERTASSMAALATTLKLLEDRTADRMGAFEAAQQDDLLASARLLTDRLAQASILLSGALGKPMSDEDWVEWRRGERSVFSRRTVALLNRRERKDVKTLLESDPEFARHAREFTASFDALVRRFETSTPPLAAALQGSDQGRLAALLIEALDG